jgi:hypothetical protein
MSVLSFRFRIISVNIKGFGVLIRGRHLLVQRLPRSQSPHHFQEVVATFNMIFAEIVFRIFFFGFFVLWDLIILFSRFFFLVILNTINSIPLAILTFQVIPILSLIFLLCRTHCVNDLTHFFPVSAAALYSILSYSAAPTASTI